ncbi:chaperonin 10-like protein [Halteromyces radiatus]|uniref:chaperonin 10-like protein n=1 Tax=Halteromyces radiatus TaxID=101107 RepID=UPI002220EF05|nr:chaperonin 10-like protein [Halteromyces radiatus]KAI8081743.1 chaperonin 10-like protein [Halteromyces radiatus]
MPFQINSFVTSDVHGKFKESTRPVEELGPHQILIELAAAGICHTDCLYLDQQGLVLGHEPVGYVKEMGSAVTGFTKGDYVGFSYMQSACLTCDQCCAGDDLYCKDRVCFPGNGSNNGFADAAVVDSRFTYHIPSEIEPKHAAPLMCAGSTVFNGLLSTNLSPTASVGIVGIGGLGHLALQFANKWGCHVTAISTSNSKKEEALSFGAHAFLNSNDFATPGFFDSAPKFDLILNTTSVDLPYDDYIKLLKPKGQFLLIGVPSKSVEVSAFPFIGYELGMRGSLVGGRRAVRLMLEFAARHGIKPQVEEYPYTLQGLEQAMERCENYKARYRAVLVKDKQ